jgi:hypothetical protein
VGIAVAAVDWSLNARHDRIRRRHVTLATPLRTDNDHRPHRRIPGCGRVTTPGSGRIAADRVGLVPLLVVRWEASSRAAVAGQACAGPGTSWRNPRPQSWGGVWMALRGHDGVREPTWHACGLRAGSLRPGAPTPASVTIAGRQLVAQPVVAGWAALPPHELWHRGRLHARPRPRRARHTTLVAPELVGRPPVGRGVRCARNPRRREAVCLVETSLGDLSAIVNASRAAPSTPHA